jgi:hypothetical protein
MKASQNPVVGRWRIVEADLWERVRRNRRASEASITAALLYVRAARPSYSPALSALPRRAFASYCHALGTAVQ